MILLVINGRRYGGELMESESFLDKLQDVTHYETLKNERGHPYELRIHYAIIALFNLPWFYTLGKDAQKEVVAAKLKNLVCTIEEAMKEIKEL